MVSSVKLVTEEGNGFYAWNNKIYDSDIVRACIRPKVKAVGKLIAKHIRDIEKTNPETGKKEKDIVVNPDIYIKFLLEEPNAVMTGQMLQEKMATQLCINNNAFALIMRDGNGTPTEIYPITATGVEALYAKNGELFLRFYMQNGKVFVFAYKDILHLRQDYGENDVFGTSLFPALEPLMQVVTTIDQGLIKAIKNSSLIRWLLKFTTSLKPDDILKRTQDFVDSFMSVEKGIGAAGVDPKMVPEQVTPHDYVPNSAVMEKTKTRVYELFNTNIKIVNSSRTEDEWNGYFDAEIEPVLMQMKNEWTRKIFSRKARSFGNRIVFESSFWDGASISTKLQLQAMVDRNALLPNEWRAAFNLAPVPGGDRPLLRKDTGSVGGEK